MGFLLQITMKIIKNKRGSIILVTIFFILMSISFLGFSYDIARIMYYKTYTRNLASVMALSTVNECGYVYHDAQNGARVVIVHNPNSKPLNYKGKYYANNEYIRILYEKNKSGMDQTYHVNPDQILINPLHIRDAVITDAIDTNRFEVGSDGVNGEVEIHITAEVDLYFLKTPFRGKMKIHEFAIAQPTATAVSNYEVLREEQEVIFYHDATW